MRKLLVATLLYMCANVYASTAYIPPTFSINAPDIRTNINTVTVTIDYYAQTIHIIKT